MYCPKCGNELIPGQRFCQQCGTQVSSSSQAVPDVAPQTQNVAQQQAVQETQPQVPQQNPQVPQEYPQVPQQQDLQEDPKPKKRRKWPIVVGALAAVAAIAAVVVVFVVLPMLSPRGVWVMTRSTTEGKLDDGSSYGYDDVYTLDEHGRLVSCVSTYHNPYTDEDDVTNYTYTFDDEGHCLILVATDEDDGDSYTTKYSWKAGEGDKTVAMSSTFDSQESVGCTYEYNPQGNIGKRTVTYADGDEFVYEYNEDGDTIRSLRTMDDETVESTYTYEYDQQHRPKTCAIKTVDQKTGKTVREASETFEYDENGNIVREVSESTSYDDDGTTTTGKSEYSYEFEYVEDPLPWIVTLGHLVSGTTNIY